MQCVREKYNQCDRDMTTITFKRSHIRKHSNRMKKSNNTNNYCLLHLSLTDVG
jgi:hypothetical protein